MKRGKATWITPAAAAIVFCGLAGCSNNRLETGYQPRPLGAGDAERKAFYSAKYTRAAVLAEQEKGKDAEFRARRPDYRPGM
jgi:hypothetical protein